MTDNISFLVPRFGIIGAIVTVHIKFFDVNLFGNLCERSILSY